MGNIQHDIPRTDHRDASAEKIFFLAEGRQQVVVKDKILGVVNSGQVLAWQPQPFGPLGTGRDQHSLKTGFEQVLQHDISAATDDHISKIINTGNVQDLLELGPQARFHLEFIRVNAILRQAAGLDVAVKHDHAAPTFGQFPRRVQACRAGSDDGHHVLQVFHQPSPLPVLRVNYSRGTGDGQGQKSYGDLTLILSCGWNSML